MQKKTKSWIPMGLPEAQYQAPTDLFKSLYAQAVIEAEIRPAGVQPKREAKLLTVIGLTTMHAILHLCCTNLDISKNGFTKLSAKINASI